MNKNYLFLFGILSFFIFSVCYAEPGWESLNDAFGIQLWQDDSLWDDKDGEAAKRLKLREESRTLWEDEKSDDKSVSPLLQRLIPEEKSMMSEEASFRRYPSKKDLILGTRAYSFALYAKNGKVAYISIVFANKGDIKELSSDSGVNWRNYNKIIIENGKKLKQKLTSVLGKSKTDKFGQGKATGEVVERWDWNGHSILLAMPEDEYAALRVVPSEVADSMGKPDKISDVKLREILEKRVKRRKNGDVIITGIPMVNQGQKGYCVPATWERYLRYVGIPADMYVLAMAGDTGVTGGTSIDAMANGAEQLVRKNRRSIKQLNFHSIKARKFSKYIDKGLPVMWSMVSEEERNNKITKRSKKRLTVSDWNKWIEELVPVRKSAKQMIINKLKGRHVCLIIGYNKRTKEIAISDSYGPEYAERWITEEEAQAISRDDFRIIKW